MKIFNTLILVASILLISACADLKPLQPPLNQEITWETRQASLSCVTQWKLAGGIAIKTPEENISASLHWEQNNQNKYDILVFGPLGSGSVKLIGRKNAVTLQTSKGKRATAPTVETLMEQEIGWSLPVSDLYYWIRGLPAPETPARQSFDMYNHLTQLEQQGWTIQYKKYAAIFGLDLPAKVFMAHDATSVKIVVSHWKIQKNCPQELTSPH